ncbi:hypothetical protein ACOT15_01530, partial [Bacteroides fragilis]
MELFSIRIQRTFQLVSTEAIHSKYAYGPEINQFIEECEKNALHNEIVAGIYGSHPTSRVNVESPISQDLAQVNCLRS